MTSNEVVVFSFHSYGPSENTNSAVSWLSTFCSSMVLLNIGVRHGYHEFVAINSSQKKFHKIFDNEFVSSIRALFPTPCPNRRLIDLK